MKNEGQFDINIGEARKKLSQDWVSMGILVITSTLQRRDEFE